MVIPQDIQEIIGKQNLYYLATASKDGKPNLICLTFIKVYDDYQLLIADNKFEKTRKNLEENPQIAIVVYDEASRASYQLKGTASLHTEGDCFEDTISWVNERIPDGHIKPKAGVVLNVEEIYCGTERVVQ